MVTRHGMASRSEWPHSCWPLQKSFGDQLAVLREELRQVPPRVRAAAVGQSLPTGPRASTVARSVKQTVAQAQPRARSRPSDGRTHSLTRNLWLAHASTRSHSRTQARTQALARSLAHAFTCARVRATCVVVRAHATPPRRLLRRIGACIQAHAAKRAAEAQLERLAADLASATPAPRAAPRMPSVACVAQLASPLPHLHRDWAHPCRTSWAQCPTRLHPTLRPPSAAAT
jgi:hypothetical protein